ncbi:histone deacetylase HDT2-like [Phoenix dactylifera]|uniref:Histone deacetylase HDT2-like n=1 Tax=Phoenix dactylifera TaxID=42345 RepID=A0A8B7CRE3_PHODC|nr:histone deacetylase HDT2-like [Phoenix dactylifera]
MEFWGVEVKPGQTVKCDPGDIKCLHLSQASLGETKKGKGDENVPIFVKFNDQKLVLGTLSAEKCAQISFDLVFEKEFELSHSSKNASVYFCGYKAIMQDAFGSDDDFSDDESDSEDDLQIGQKANGKLDVKGEQGKSATGKVGNKVDASAAKPKAKTKESGKADKLKADEDAEDDEDEEDEEDEEEDDSEEVSDEDEDLVQALGDSDDEDEDSEEEDEATPKKAETGKKRLADSALKTPGSEKKAKIEKTGAVGKKGQTATPAPAKQAGRTPADSDKSKQQTPKSSGSVSCKSCSKTFGSENAVQAHTKAKHSGGK